MMVVLTGSNLTRGVHTSDSEDDTATIKRVPHLPGAHPTTPDNSLVPAVAW